MTELQFPSGDTIDFEDANEQQIRDAVDGLRERNPELFVEKPIDYSTASFEEIVEKAQGSGGERSTDTPARPRVEITHAGELEDLGAQYDYAKADTDSGRADWITNRYGPDTFGQDENGRFYLKLDNIDPELRARDNLKDSGSMYINRPGGYFLGIMDLSDVVGFGGAYQGPLLATTAAAFATTGVGLPAGLVMCFLYFWKDHHSMDGKFYANQLGEEERKQST